MTAIWTFITAHPVISTLVIYYIVSAFIGALPSPTATSGMLYQFFFKFANTLGGNLLRALSSKIESSPNFQGALDKQTQLAGLPLITVKPAPPAVVP